MKTCKSTKTRVGCGKEKEDTAFKISSINQNTNKVYRKSICSKCEYRDEKIVQQIEISSEAELFKMTNAVWR